MIQHATDDGFGAMQFEDDAIIRKAAMLPNEVRNDWEWLVTYTRNACDGKPELLASRFREVGVYSDKSTWTKVLKGQLTRTPEGLPRSNPLINLDRFSEQVRALRNQVSIEAMRGKVPFVATPTARTIWAYLDLKRSPDRVNRFGVVIGPTGSQKTASFKEYIRRRAKRDSFWVEAPENAALGEMISMLSVACGGTDRETVGQSRRRVFRTVGAEDLVIVDNCQRLYQENRGRTQPLFGFLQRLQDERNCAVILSFTPEFERTLTAGLMRGYFEQFEGRAGGRQNFLRLTEYALPDDVVEIARAFGLREPKRSEKALLSIARKEGRIRILFEVLQDAKLLAGKDPLTLDHVRQVIEEVEE